MTSLLLAAILTASPAMVPPMPEPPPLLVAAASMAPAASSAPVKPAPQQSWSKRHPAGTVALSIIGGAVLGAVSCHNGWLICGDDDETGKVRTVVVEGHGHCSKGGCD